MSARKLQEQYPSLPWREPLPVQRTDSDEVFFVCRICIGLTGLQAKDLEKWPRNREACVAHIEKEHPDKIETPDPKTP